MKISVIGTGAMGSLFSGYLSKHNQVTLVGVNPDTVETINRNGVTINEQDGTSSVYSLRAVSDSSDMPDQDLVILLVKTMFSQGALEQNRNLIGPQTYLMTLQNGAGHENVLLGFADREHVIIGTTQHNSSVVKPGTINHGGSGLTCIGLLDGVNEDLKRIASVFTEAGFECRTEEDIRRSVWMKLFINSSASALTALLNVPLGFIHSDSHANFLMRKLCKEAVTVANYLGFGFDPEEVCQAVDKVCRNAPDAVTSLLSDIISGRRTEIDSINGSVVDSAHKQGIHVPFHQMVLSAIHALENRSKGENNAECL